MKKANIVSIVGARPNFIKLAPIHNALINTCNHIIIHTGQHYDYKLSKIFFENFSLPEPTFNLEIGSGLPAYQVGEMIKGIEKVLSANKFDLALVYGDTNSTFAGAFASIKSGIKVAHVEAGLRSFDRRMPEEINRILTDNLSNLLFAPTKTAVQNLNKENIFGKIIETGDVSVEMIKQTKTLTTKSKILDLLQLGSKSYVLFTMHRAENTVFKESFLSIIKAFEQLKDTKIIFPIHPRTKKILQEINLYNRISACKNVKVIEPLGYIDFMCLIQNSSKIVTDSGGVQKESYLLSVPCITIRRNTEWVETVEEGWNVIVDTDTEKIVKHVKEWNPSNIKPKPIFGNGNTSTKIKKKILEELE